jgi:hypothetical protein
MEIGNIKSWERSGAPFSKSGQGEVRRVTRVGDTDGALNVLRRCTLGRPAGQSDRNDSSGNSKRFASWMGPVTSGLE